MPVFVEGLKLRVGGKVEIVVHDRRGGRACDQGVSRREDPLTHDRFATGIEPEGCDPRCLLDRDQLVMNQVEAVDAGEGDVGWMRERPKVTCRKVEQLHAAVVRDVELPLVGRERDAVGPVENARLHDSAQPLTLRIQSVDGPFLRIGDVGAAVPCHHKVVEEMLAGRRQNLGDEDAGRRIEDEDAGAPEVGPAVSLHVGAVDLATGEKLAVPGIDPQSQDAPDSALPLGRQVSVQSCKVERNDLPQVGAAEEEGSPRRVVDDALGDEIGFVEGEGDLTGSDRPPDLSDLHFEVAVARKLADRGEARVLGDLRTETEGDDARERPECPVRLARRSLGAGKVLENFGHLRRGPSRYLEKPKRRCGVAVLQRLSPLPQGSQIGFVERLDLGLPEQGEKGRDRKHGGSCPQTSPAREPAPRRS
jgi:hypothetical protein